MIPRGDGTFIKDPHYQDLGEGKVLTGGYVVDDSGKVLGHLDSPGAKGAEGVPGLSPNDSTMASNTSGRE
jgi:hypothetical protein